MRLGGVLLDLAADVCHVDAQDLVAALALRPPQLLHNEVIGEHLARALAQQRDDPVLILREMSVLARDEHLMLVVIYGQVARDELAGVDESLV